MNKNSFTVLMCTYYKDDAHLLKKAIESVFKNTIKPDFFILTIDGPIPIFNEKIIIDISKRYPIKLNFLKKNMGLAIALNNALDLVKTEWIARADSDDINSKIRFEKQLKIAKNNVDIIGGNILEIDNKGEFPKLTKKIPITHQEIKRYIKLRNPINHMTAFYKTDLIKSVGGYPNLYLREDYALWAKLIHKKAIFQNIDEVLVYVNGGKSLYKRRSGFKNALSEINLQILLCKYKIKPFYIAFLHFFLRTTFLLLPQFIINKLYLKSFRNKTYK